MKLKSSGGSGTLLGSVTEPEQLPFCGGSDDNQHNTKAHLREARGNGILINGTTVRFDETSTSLRGPVAVENSDDLWLTTPGDVSASHYKGKSLTEILGAERAKWWHRTFCKLVTKRVLDSKGKMASRPAVALGKCGALLREIGEVEEGAMSDATFADLLALSHNFPRGVDDKCKALTGRGLLHLHSTYASEVPQGGLVR